MSKQISLLSAVTLVVALYAAPGLTHDPEEHEAESTTPECAAIANIDASKVDSNDPVMKAILQKCQAAMDGDDNDDDGHHDEERSEEHSADESHRDASAQSETHGSR